MSEDPDTKDNTKEERKEYLESQINKFDLRIDAASENGLFNGKKHLRDDVIKSLRITRESFDKGKYSDCEKHLSQTWGKYTDALNSKTYSWRLFNLHAIHIWIYLVAILVAIFSIYYFGLINCPVENGGGQKTGVQSIANASNNNSTSGEQCYLNKAFGKDLVGFYAVTWGCVGAVFRGLWYLKDKVDDKLFRNAWNIYYLSVPFLGGILGAIMYFIIIGGLISVTSTNVNILHPIPVIVFASLAGFNWEWAVNIFKKIGDSLTPSVEKQ